MWHYKKPEFTLNVKVGEIEKEYQKRHLPDQVFEQLSAGNWFFSIESFSFPLCSLPFPDKPAIPVIHFNQATDLYQYGIALFNEFGFCLPEARFYKIGQARDQYND